MHWLWVHVCDWHDSPDKTEILSAGNNLTTIFTSNSSQYTVSSSSSLEMLLK